MKYTRHQNNISEAFILIKSKTAHDNTENVRKHNTTQPHEEKNKKHRVLVRRILEIDIKKEQEYY